MDSREEQSHPLFWGALPYGVDPGPSFSFSANAIPQSLTIHLNGLVCRLVCRLGLGKLISSEIMQDVMGSVFITYLSVLFRKAIHRSASSCTW